MVIETTDDSETSRREASGRARVHRSRSDLEAAIARQREKIRNDFRGLREELELLPVRQVVRDHPLKLVLGLGLAGFLVGSGLFGRSGRRKSGSSGADERVLDELLEVIVEDAAHRVEAGADAREALREVLRAHGPIVFEVERSSESEQGSILGSLLNVALDLTAPYLRQYATAWLEDRMSSPEP
jgi:hypothetical protein